MCIIYNVSVHAVKCGSPAFHTVQECLYAHTLIQTQCSPALCLKNYSLQLHASAVAASPCRVRLRKWHAQLQLSRKSQLEPSTDSVGYFPTTEVTLVANNPTNQIRFKSFLRRSMSPLGDKPDADQGVELMGMRVKTEYNDFTELLVRPDHESTSSPSDSNIHHDL